MAAERERFVEVTRLTSTIAVENVYFCIDPSLSSKADYEEWFSVTLRMVRYYVTAHYSEIVPAELIAYVKRRHGLYKGREIKLFMEDSTNLFVECRDIIEVIRAPKQLR